MAAAIVRQSTDDEDQGNEPADPKAVDRGKKGGVARSAALTPGERSAIARKAAEARWPTQ